MQFLRTAFVPNNFAHVGESSLVLGPTAPLVRCQGVGASHAHGSDVRRVPHKPRHHGMLGRDAHPNGLLETELHRAYLTLQETHSGFGGPI